jgi:hypothetical protein
MEWMEKAFRVGQGPQRDSVPILTLIIIQLNYLIIIIIYMLNTDALTALLNVYSFCIILTPTNLRNYQ